MPHFIADLFEPRPRRRWPAPGRHRASTRRSVGPGAEASALCPPRISAVPAPRGVGIGLVRPYPIAHGRRERQHRRAPRHALWVIVHRIDAGARPFHRVRVGARCV